jgi:hypothetical protein
VKKRELQVKASEVQVGDSIQLADESWVRVREINPGFYRRSLAFTYTKQGQTDVACVGKRETVFIRRKAEDEESK